MWIDTCTVPLCMKMPPLLENLSMQYTKQFFSCKNENVIGKNVDVFNTFAKNIVCGYKLEPPRRCGSNEYPQSMFCIKIRKKIGFTLHTPVLLYTSGV